MAYGGAFRDMRIRRENTINNYYKYSDTV